MPRERTPLLRYTKDDSNTQDTIFIERSQTAVNFLIHLFQSDVLACAQIANAQANGDKELIIGMLENAKEFIENQIKEIAIC